MRSKIPPQSFLKSVATYYDGKQKDLNLLLADKDGRVHHHNGTCDPDFIPSAIMTEEEILRLLHQQENDLTNFGMKFLEDVKSTMHVLDAGCGRGGSAFMIHEKFKCSVLGINVSHYQIQFAQKLAQKLGVTDCVQFINANMLNTPFSDNYFDFIWACESTEHVPDLEEMFLEFSRILKATGKLLIITWCTNLNQKGSKEIINQLNNAYVASVHPKTDYLNIPSAAGFHLIEDIDITLKTLPYWRLRLRSKNATGTESFMNQGFSSGVLEYHLFQYKPVY